MALFLCRIVMHLLGHVSLQVGYSAPTQSGIIHEVGLSISEVCDNILENKVFFKLQHIATFFNRNCGN
jgi:hypothetical protein